MACMQATRGYPPEVVDKHGKFNLDGVQMEVDSQGGADREVQDQKTWGSAEAKRKPA